MRRYLARSVPFEDSEGLPLDIEINWLEDADVDKEDAFIAKHPSEFSEEPVT